MLKKVLLATLLIITATLSLASCGDDSDEVKVEVSDDGYVVVNGNKTEHKVDTKDEITVDEEGHLVVNGNKTDYLVDKADVITVDADGYVVVNGTKTEHKVHTKDEITIDEEGYLVVNGVKTEYAVDYCNHEYETVTTQPTCTEGGYDTKTCKLCDKIVIANKQDAMGHDVPSYTIDGDYHYIECTRCDYATEKEMHVAGDDNLCVKCKTPVSATAGIVYDLSADGTYAVVIGYEGTDTAVKIADTYEGVPVKEIYSEAFKETSITSVVIPDSVTSIGADAFHYCYSLTSVVIPDSVTSIGYYAFFGCNSALYTEYEYGKYVGDGENPYAVLIEVTNKNMTTYTINPATRIIADRVFSGCERLANITIPDSVTSIGERAFDGCYSLTSIKYRGTEEQWNAITTGKDYKPYSCMITYNYTGE